MMDLITSGQAGVLLGVSSKTVNRWADAGILRPVGRLSGPISIRVFDRVDVERFAQQRHIAH